MQDIAAGASKLEGMGWVVTGWRTDRLAALLDERARVSARQVLWEAERDAYRVRTAAARESGSAATTLDEIERLGVELRDAIRRYRTGAGPDPLASPASVAPFDPSEADAPPPEPLRAARLAPARRPRPGRASLHDSPLAAMMRAGAAR